MTETRILPPFDKIYLEDNIDLVLKQGPVQEVKVEAGENLVPLIKMEVTGSNELRIRNDNKCNWARNYKKGHITVYLTSPDYSILKHWGSGSIRSADTLTEDTLQILTHESGDVDLTVKTHVTYTQNIGSSDITLHGTTDLLGNYHNGEGYNYFEDLQADFIWTTSEASGNEYYHPLSVMAVTINWEGDVYYKGTPPTINLQGRGTGKLIPLN